MFKKTLSIAALALAFTACRGTGSQTSGDSELMADSSTGLAHATAQSGTYRLKAFNFAHNVMTFTPAYILNPPIQADKVKISSPNCQGLITAYAKTNVPQFGVFTLNPMTPIGNKTWKYAATPIRAIQIGFQQLQQWPAAPVCDLLIEPVTGDNGGGDNGGGDNGGNSCLSVDEGYQLLMCQQNSSNSLECQLLKRRYDSHGLCQ